MNRNDAKSCCWSERNTDQHQTKISCAKRDDLVTEETEARVPLSGTLRAGRTWWDHHHHHHLHNPVFNVNTAPERNTQITNTEPQDERQNLRELPSTRPAPPRPLLGSGNPREEKSFIYTLHWGNIMTLQCDLQDEREVQTPGTFTISSSIFKDIKTV